MVQEKARLRLDQAPVRAFDPAASAGLTPGMGSRMSRRTFLLLYFMTLAQGRGTMQNNNSKRPIRPLRLVRRADGLDLQTRVYTYEYQREREKGMNSLAVAPAAQRVELYSMVHVADSEYFQAIQRRVDGSDVVLYELITSRVNTASSCPSPALSYKRSLSVAVDSPLSAIRLAKTLQLDTQISLPLQRSNWFVADLDAETVQALEQVRIGRTRIDSWLQRLTGRDAWRPTLPKFFLSDAPLVTALRAVSWLAVPCPELTVLLLDWARGGPGGAGGVPVSSISAIVTLLSRGEFRAANKVAFAQTLVTGVHDSGSWGGAAESDVAVRVQARNEECCRRLQLCLDDRDSRPARIAVLYGAFHIRDLNARFERMGLRRVEEGKGGGGEGVRGNSESRGRGGDTLTAWSIPVPEGGVGEAGPGGVAARLVAILGGMSFLLFGTVDWVVLYRVLLGGGFEAGSGLEGVVATLCWVYLYLLRHAWLYDKASNVGVLWDSGLFEGSD